MNKKFLSAALAAAMTLSLLSGAVVFADGANSARAGGGSTEAVISGIESGTAIAVKYDENGAMTGFAPADLPAGDGEKEVRFDGIEADKVLVWDSLSGMDPLCEPINVESAPPPTAAPTGEPSQTPTSAPTYETGWNFNNIAAGTEYQSEDKIKDDKEREMIITKADFDTVSPMIKERAAGDNYLEFNDASDGSTGQRQDSWQVSHGAEADCDAVVYTMDVKKSNLEKDTILFRVYDTANTTADNSYGSDGRSFELKTGENGKLALADYFSGDDNNKAVQKDVSGFTYAADKWFSVKVEYIRAEKTVNVYAGDTADSVKLRSTFVLGTLGTKNKTVPVLAPDKVSCHTPGGGKVVLGVDNVDITAVTYKAQSVPVSGSVYTTYSDDMKNKPEPFEGAGASLTFTDKDGKAVTAEVGADGRYKTELMSDAEYAVSVSGAEGYALSPLSGSLSIGIRDMSADKDVLLAGSLGEVEYKDTLEVGEGKEYDTINKALSAVRKMTRTDGRTVTIKIDPGTYEEQLYIDMNDIALVAADPEDKPLIQWYYGIGYKYWSAAADGWYSADNAVAKTDKHEVSNWGAVIRLTDSVKNIYMENLDVQNTFNLYITDTELADGIEITSKNFDRSNKNANVRSYGSDGPKERAAAIMAAGSEIELYRCSFVSSQDTFGTNTESMYVKECDIAGNTDYICGGNNAYFEGCNLIWMGYSDSNRGGEITAHKLSSKANVDDYSGYYFKDCTVMNRGESGMRYPNGGSSARSNWGRPWGNTNCMVIFDNTTIAGGAVKPSGWGSMSGNPMTNAKAAFVINGVWKDGVDVAASEDNPKGTAASLNYPIPAPEDFFGGWEPRHYVVDSSLIALKSEISGKGSVVFEVDGRTATRAQEGASVKVKAVPAANQELKSLTLKTESGADITLDENNAFTMPAEAVTAHAVFEQKSLGKYSAWQIGEQSSGSGDGEAENVTYEGKDALHVKAKNAYLPLESPVSTGKAVFDFEIYIDTSVDRNFRVYLENEQGTWQNTDAVMAEVINNRGSQVNTGPAIDSKTNPLFTYAQLGESGWVHFTITMDYSKASAGDFITITAKKADGSELGAKSMGVISGEDTTLKSIRFVTTAADSYYADMSLKTE